MMDQITKDILLLGALNVGVKAIKERGVGDITKKISSIVDKLLDKTDLTELLINGGLAYAGIEYLPNIPGLENVGFMRALYGPIAYKLATTPASGSEVSVMWGAVQVPLNSQMIGMLMLASLGFCGVLNEMMPAYKEFQDGIYSNHMDNVTDQTHVEDVPDPQISRVEGMGFIPLFWVACPFGDWKKIAFSPINLEQVVELYQEHYRAYHPTQN